MIQHLLLSVPSRGACAVTLVLAAALSPILADAAPPDAAELTYQSDRANCQSGRSQQELQACLREAAAARSAARKGLLTTETPQVLRDNARLRCQAQAAGPDRTACERMAQGEGQVSGSVAAGGELHELTTVMPPKRTAPRSLPSQPAPPGGAPKSVP